MKGSLNRKGGHNHSHHKGNDACCDEPIKRDLHLAPPELPIEHFMKAMMSLSAQAFLLGQSVARILGCHEAGQNCCSGQLSLDR